MAEAQAEFTIGEVINVTDTDKGKRIVAILNNGEEVVFQADMFEFSEGDWLEFIVKDGEVFSFAEAELDDELEEMI